MNADSMTLNATRRLQAPPSENLVNAARPLPDLPDQENTSRAKIGQTQPVEKQDLIGVCPTARLIFKENVL